MGATPRPAEPPVDVRRLRLSRRLLLTLVGGLGANAILTACVHKSAGNGDRVHASASETPDQDPLPDEEVGTVAPTEVPRSLELGYGPIEIEVWYQQWDGANRLLQGVGETFIEGRDDATVILQAIGYSDLYQSLLPAIAAGDEGDVLMMHTNWVVGADIGQLFLDITGPLGGYAGYVEKFWEAPLAIVDAPEERVFYLPWLAGVRGAAITVNRDHLAEEGIDPLDFRTWEEVIDAGRKLTRRDAADNMVRAGYAINASQPSLLYNIIWGLGGSMYNRATATWSWHSDEGLEAARRLFDLYWTEGVSSYGLYATELQGVSDGLISIWGEGAWTAAVQAQTAGIPADNVVTPRLADGVTDDLFPGHLAGWGFSRRLAGEADRLAVALDFAMAIVGPEAMVPFFDEQSSLCATKSVYEDARISFQTYGPMSKRVAMEMWPRARYNGDWVSEKGPAYDQLDLALRGEISAGEALRAMDAYCQAQEDEARGRLAE